MDAYVHGSGERTPQPRSSHHEVVVVGGGIAGLIAGWNLRDRDVLVLEANERAGGRVSSVSSGPYWLNLGAHTIAWTDGLLRQYARALGLLLVVPRGSMMAVAMGGRLIRASRPEELPFRLPLAPAARASLVRVGIRLRRAYRAVTRAERSGQFGAAARIDHMAVDPALDDQSYGDVLGPMHPDVAALMRVTANRMGTEPDRVSGHKGVWNALGVWGTRRANVVGGNSVLTDALAATLGGRVWTGATVRRIAQTASEVAVDVDARGHSERLTADACIVTVPAPAARELVDGLPSEKDGALSRIPYGPYVVAGMFTSETEPMPWDDVYAVAVPGRSFSMLFNPANPLRTGLRRPGGGLVVYAAGDPAADLLPLSDEAITDRFLGDLHDVLPATRGLVRDVMIQRWPVGIPIAAPGRARLQPQLAAPCGRVHFAGDYIGEPGLDSAAWTAEVAAQSVRDMLPERTG